MWNEYLFASSVDDALKILHDRGGKARLIAGGTDLVLDARSKKFEFDCAVDTTRIPELDKIIETDDYIVVGANVTFHNLWTSSLINRTSHVLAEAAHNLAAWSIQNVATLVGNVVTAQPAGDGSIALVALGAEAEIARLDGRQWVAVTSLYAGPGRSRLDSSREMITRFRWRKAGPRQASACERIAKGEVVALPIASCGVDLQLTEDLEHIAWVRMALGPVALTPYRASCVEDSLRGAQIDDDMYIQAAEQAAFACNMRTNILRASKEYREELIKVLVRRALKRAVEAARSGGQPSVSGRLTWNRYWSGANTVRPNDGKVTFVLNGRENTVEAKPGEMLVNVLREELGLTGTKIGCDEGECGACTVLIDGQPVLSCLYPVYKVQGRNVQTVEGVASDEKLHPVQAALVSHDAIQCGYCTPGMVMTAISILEDIPNPTVEEIKDGLGNNYCRCTGYVKIVDAIQDAAAVIRGDKASLTQIELPRKDAVARVTGEEKYGSDLKLDNMLYGKVVWSGVAHAEILGIDTSAAETTPGVVRVITHKDVPGKNLFGSMGYDQPALAEGKVLFAGEAVAVVYAETKEAAAAGASRVKVTYRELPGVFTPQESLKEGAPILKGENNVFHRTLVEKGDIDAGFKQADIIIEDDYQTQAIEHLFLETEGGIGVMDDGVVTVYQATQWPPGDQMQLADILGLPLEKVRVVQTPIGGAFGGKMDLTTHPYLALGAYLTGRPVKVVLTRPESIRMHVKRHPFYLHYKLGATREGKIVALHAQIVSDGGAYRSTTDDVLEQATVFASGPYAIPNVKLTGVSARTNNVPCGAMRGFGAQQVTFAMESQVDRLALALEMDPFVLRRKNMLDVGSTLVTGQILKNSIGAKPVLEAAEKALKKVHLPEPKPGKRIGIGVAAGMKNVGLGIGNDDSVHVSLELEPDGKILLRQGAIDLGQGSNSAMCQIAAKAMDIDYDLIRNLAGDTKYGQDGGITAASRQTHMTGQASYKVSTQFKTTLVEYAAKVYQVDPQKIKLTHEGDVIDLGREERIGNLQDLAKKAEERGEKVYEHLHYIPPKTYRIMPVEKRKDMGISDDEYINYPAFCFGCQVIISEVDEETGHVDVLKVIAAHDVGTAIRPASVEGQIEGGVVMGLGYALTEEFIQEKGVVISDEFHKITTPRSTLPTEIQTILVDDPHPHGPFGAKGVGEGAYMPTAPAVVNSINNAVGVRIKSIPATKDKVLAGIINKRNAEN